MTKYEVVGNPNYSAQVVQVENLVTLAGLDNLVGLPWGGYTALVSKDVSVGDIVVVFPAESELTVQFAGALNLYRHTERNANPDKAGYLEDNSRIKAIRLRGHVSSALALPLGDLLQFADEPPAIGTAFDTIDGVTISRKYEIPVKGGSMAGKSAQEKAWRRVEDKFLPEHIESVNYWRNAHLIDPDTWVTVSQKLHGTSWRGGRTIVKRNLSWFERVAKRLGVTVQETEYDYVFGSRKVIKDPHNPKQDHFYGFDLWSEFGSRIESLLPDNVIVYGELVGWLPDGRPIQKGYTYDLPVGELALYVYRVSVVTNDGHQYDLPWDGMERFCAERGFKVVPLLWQGFHKDFNADDWTDIVYTDTFPQAVPLSNKGTVDEGVVVRAEGILPTALKAKSPLFFVHESKVLSQGQIDVESEG